MASTFHFFPQLPYELRAIVWSFAAHPRNVPISVQWSFWTTAQYIVRLPAPQAPAVMHTCREARQHAPYRKAFVVTRVDDGDPNRPCADYIWLNFDLDMICLPLEGGEEFLKPHYADIRRLRLTCPSSEEEGFEWYHEAITYLDGEPFDHFTALREFHLAFPDCLMSWAKIYWNGFTLPCARENIRFIDLQSGLVLKGDEAYMVDVWIDEDGGRVKDMDRLERELRLASREGSFHELIRYERVENMYEETEEDADDSVSWDIPSREAHF